MCYTLFCVFRIVQLMWWLGLIPVPCSSLYMESRHRPWTSVPITNSDSTPMCRYNAVPTVTMNTIVVVDNSEPQCIIILHTHTHTAMAVPSIQTDLYERIRGRTIWKSSSHGSSSKCHRISIHSTFFIILM